MNLVYGLLGFRFSVLPGGERARGGGRWELDGGYIRVGDVYICVRFVFWCEIGSGLPRCRNLVFSGLENENKNRKSGSAGGWMWRIGCGGV